MTPFSLSDNVAWIQKTLTRFIRLLRIDTRQISKHRKNFNAEGKPIIPGNLLSEQYRKNKCVGNNLFDDSNQDKDTTGFMDEKDDVKIC